MARAFKSTSGSTSASLKAAAEYDELLRQTVGGFAVDSASTRALVEQAKLARQLADTVTAAEGFIAQANLPGSAQHAIEEQRRLAGMTAGNIHSGLAPVVAGAAQAVDEHRRLQALIDRAVMPDQRYVSRARETLDAIGAFVPVRQPKPVAAPVPQSVASTAAPIRTVGEIGARVRAARQAMGMTQQRFADLAGVGRRFIVELERGKPGLETGKVLTVCSAAGVTLTFAA